MELKEEHAADNDRYAFLLGSALRTADLDHFFCIYDSIIPKELSEFQVEKIKEEARSIADLPEDEFNELVLNARDFSLARGRPPSSPTLAMSTNGHDVNDPSDEEESIIAPCMDVPKLDLATKAHSDKSNMAGITDDDSGLPSSTKTGHRTSVSSEDSADFEERDLVQCGPLNSKLLSQKEEKKTEEKTPRGRELVMISHCYNPQYDEEVMVETDNESLESPRSDSSGNREYDMTEMKEEYSMKRAGLSSAHSKEASYSYCQRDQYNATYNIHKSLYGRPSFGSSTPVFKNRGASSTTINFARSSNILAKGQTISSLRGSSAATREHSVDDVVNFSLGSPSNKRHYSPDCARVVTASHVSPPFGTGDNLLRKIGDSVCSLVKPSSSDLGPPNSDMGSLQDNMKKKKKKKEAREMCTTKNSEPMPLSKLSLGVSVSENDGTQETGIRKVTDLNGNPVELEGSPMRDHGHDKSSSLVSSSEGRGPSVFLHHEASGDKGPEMAHRADDFSTSANSSHSNKRKGKQKQGKEVHPEKDEGYVGHITNVDELVRYINNECSQKDIKKRGQQPADAGRNKASAKSAPVKVSKKSRGKIKSQTDTGDKVETTPSPHFAFTLTDPAQLVASICEAEETVRSEFWGSVHVDQYTEQSMGNSSSSESSGGREERSVNQAETICAQFEETDASPAVSDWKQQEGQEIPSPIKSAQLSSDNDVQEKQDSDTKNKTKSNQGSRGVDKVSSSASQNTDKFRSRSQKKDWPKSSPTTAPAPDLSTEVSSSTQGQWCTVVSNTKKKRRSPSKLQEQIIVNNSVNVNQQVDSKDTRLVISKQIPEAWSQSEHREMPHHQSVSVRSCPTSQPYVRAAGIRKCQGHELSPADFPVLSSAEWCHSAEHVDSDKDSDKESFRSLPTEKGVGAHRPVYPVSYATIASVKASHESADSSIAESVSSSMEDTNMDDFSTDSSSPMKWKGAPRERRHSIGSAAEELSKAGRCGGLQRTGSQEMLHRNKDVASVSTSGTTSGAKCLDQSNSTGSFSGSDADSAHGSEIGSESAVEEFQPVQTLLLSQSHATLSAKSTVITVTENTPTATGSGETDVRTLVPAGHLTVSAPDSESSSSSVKQGTQGNKQKVVFLDTYKDAHPLEGLQFGFFSDAERATIVNSVKDKQPMLTTTPNKDRTLNMTASEQLTISAESLSSSIGKTSTTPSPVAFNSDVSFPPLPSTSNSGASIIPSSPAISCGSTNTTSATSRVAVSKGNTTTASAAPPVAVSSGNIVAPAAAVDGHCHNPSAKPQKGCGITGLNGLVTPQSANSASLTCHSPRSPVVPSTPQGQDITVSGGDCDYPKSATERQTSSNPDLSIEPPADPQSCVSITYGCGQDGQAKSIIYHYPPDQLPGSRPSQECLMKRSFLQSSWEQVYRRYCTGKDPNLVAYWDIAKRQ